MKLFKRLGCDQMNNLNLFDKNWRIYGLSVTLMMGLVMAGCGQKEIASEVPVTTPAELPIIEIVEQAPMFEPIEVTYQDDLLLKTYIVAQDTDLQLLAEEPFIESDHHYTAKEIQRKTVIGDIETKVVTQTIPVEVPTSSQAEALLWYSQELDYTDEDGFIGKVKLNPETVTVTANGTERYHYNIKDSKQFLNLDRNDPSVIPRTTVKNGRTLNLVNVDWQVADRMMAGDSLIARKYNAIAHYSATAQGTKVTGYTANAVYTGEASKQGPDKYCCTVVYQGKLTAKGMAKRLLIPAAVILGGLIVLLPLVLYKLRLRRIKQEVQNRSAALNGSPQLSNTPAIQPAVVENNENTVSDTPLDMECDTADRADLSSANLDATINETAVPQEALPKKEKKRKPMSSIFVEMIEDETETAGGEADPNKPKAKIYLPKQEEGDSHEKS